VAQPLAGEPNFVPVSFRCSRTTQSKGVSGSTSTVAALPFTVSEIAAIRPSPGIRVLICGCFRGYWHVSRRRGVAHLADSLKCDDATLVPLEEL
jgi:hypothetical protein